VDEQKLNEKLPVFAAANLLRIPFLNVDSLSVAKVVQKFDLFEQRLLALEQRSVLSCIAHNTQPEFSNMDCSTDNGVEQTSSLEQSRSGEEMDSHDSGSWQTVNRGKLGFSAVVKSSVHSSHPTSRTPTTSSAPVRGRQKIFGTRSSDDNVTVKSGIPIVQKAVVHVDYLDVGYTEALLQDYLLANDIQVLSCYKAKSWIKEKDERDKVTAFRVCIPATQRQAIFSPDIWAKGVIIRNWQFKKTNNGG